MEWIKIEKGSLAPMLDIFRPEEIYPKSQEHSKFWRNLRAKCINGVWIEQFGKYRYVPGRLGFFGVFTRFEDWEEDEYGARDRVIKTPLVRDLEWHRAYYRLIMDGLSGFSRDYNFTCDEGIMEASKSGRGMFSQKRWENMFRKDGSFKQFIPQLDYIFQLHNGKFGYPLYYNNAKNHVELGTRGGGKSYWTALGEILYDIVFNNLKYYDPSVRSKRKTKAIIEVTSGGGGKSDELLDKVDFAMLALANPEYKGLGIWGQIEDNDYEPCPFYKPMMGHRTSGNKEKPWISAIEFKDKDGKWKKKGNYDTVYNTNYSPNQKDAGQKSAGGRRTFVVHEEAGLSVHLLTAWGSNEGMISEGGGTDKNAGQKAMGTSGNMETFEPVKEIFTHPRDYKCIAFKYPDYDPNNEYGFYLPSYMVDQKFKDEDGNTDVEAAKKYHKKIYEQEKKGSQKAFLEHRLNFPFQINDMWVTGKGKLLPEVEAESREQELMKGNLYEKLGTPIKLFKDTTADNGIGYKIDFEAKPFYNFPIESGRHDLNGCFMMYIHPEKLKINGSIPNDAVIVVHDPYVSDLEGESLGATSFWVNSKYIPYGLPGNQMAATFYGKPDLGLDEYNKILEYGVAFYGNPLHSIWYEANRGERVRGHFIKQRKLGLLCLRPQYEKGEFLFEKATNKTGFIVGNQIAKLAMIDRLNEFLLSTVSVEENGKTVEKLVIELIPCIFTIRQIKLYALKGNYDAVSALLGLPLAIAEKEHHLSQGDNTKNHQEKISKSLAKFLKKFSQN